MIEFTLSRVTLCACGVILMVAVTGVVGAINDNDRYDEDERLIQRIGYMLDTFEASDVDEMAIDGSAILPQGYVLKVHDGFAELIYNDSIHIALTSYDNEFVLEHGEVKTITHRRSLRS